MLIYSVEVSGVFLYFLIIFPVSKKKIYLFVVVKYVFKSSKYFC